MPKRSFTCAWIARGVGFSSTSTNRHHPPLASTDTRRLTLSPITGCGGKNSSLRSASNDACWFGGA